MLSHPSKRVAPGQDLGGTRCRKTSMSQREGGAGGSAPSKVMARNVARIGIADKPKRGHGPGPSGSGLLVPNRLAQPVPATTHVKAVAVRRPASWRVFQAQLWTGPRPSGRISHGRHGIVVEITGLAARTTAGLSFVGRHRRGQVMCFCGPGPRPRPSWSRSRVPGARCLADSLGGWATGLGGR